jgi:hypothetical protein
MCLLNAWKTCNIIAVNRWLAEQRREYSFAQVSAQNRGANLGHRATPYGSRHRSPRSLLTLFLSWAGQF